MNWKNILKDMKAPPFVELYGVLYKFNGSKGDDNYYVPVDEIKLYRTGKINSRMPPFQPHHTKSRQEKDITDQEVKLSTKEAIKLGEAGEKRKRSLLENTFKKEFKGSEVFVDKLKEIYNDLESDVREIKSYLGSVERLAEKKDYGIPYEELVEDLKEEFKSGMLDDNSLEPLILSKFEGDTFEKEAGGVSFGGHGTNPELFNIRYGKKRRDKNGKESK